MTLSLSKHLHGVDIASTLSDAWSPSASPHLSQSTLARFSNSGLNLNPVDLPATLSALETKLGSRNWDGVIVGWCTRGNKEFTVLFEQIVNACVEEVVRRRVEGGKDGKELKLMFCAGPEDLVNTAVRNFGGEEV